jgi:hypothetical protein
MVQLFLIMGKFQIILLGFLQPEVCIFYICQDLLCCLEFLTSSHKSDQSKNIGLVPDFLYKIL